MGYVSTEILKYLDWLESNQASKEEGKEEGRKEGREEGRKEGRKEGEERRVGEWWGEQASRMEWTECFCPHPPNPDVEILTLKVMILVGEAFGR